MNLFVTHFQKEVGAEPRIMELQGNENQLAKEIEALEDEKYYKEIADKCAQRAEGFHITKMIKNNIAVYQQVMNN